MTAAPIPMILTCPSCSARHIDAHVEGADGPGKLATKSHHTHSCQSCGMTWRPAVVPTVGVQFLPGFKDGVEAPMPKIELPSQLVETRRTATRALGVVEKERDTIAAAIDAYVPKDGGWGKTKKEYNDEVFALTRWLDDAADALRKRDAPVDLRTATALTPQATVFQQVAVERDRQDKQWGGEYHDNAHARADWLKFIAEHSDRAKKALNMNGSVRRVLGGGDLDEYRKQLVEIAALAVAAVEAHDRNSK